MRKLLLLAATVGDFREFDNERNMGKMFLFFQIRKYFEYLSLLSWANFIPVNSHIADKRGVDRHRAKCLNFIQIFLDDYLFLLIEQADIL